jgi:hypothetical protein
MYLRPSASRIQISILFTLLLTCVHSPILLLLLLKMGTTNIPGGKGGRCVRLTTSPFSRAECHEIWEPKPPGNLWATPGLLRDSFTFYYYYYHYCYYCYYHYDCVVGIATFYWLDGTGVEILRTPQDRPWGPPSLLYGGCRVSFPGVTRPWRGVDHPPASSAKVLLPLWAFVAYSKVNFTYLITQ